MNNLLSYCGLVDAKIKASDKDLPEQKMKIQMKEMENKKNILVNFAKKSTHLILR